MKRGSGVDFFGERKRGGVRSVGIRGLVLQRTRKKSRATLPRIPSDILRSARNPIVFRPRGGGKAEFRRGAIL